MESTPYVPVYTLTTLFVLAITWRAMRARPRQGATWLAATMAGVTWWSAMKTMELLTTGDVVLLFNTLHWVGVGVVSVGVLGFGLTLSGRGSTLSGRRVVLLSVIPALAVVTWALDARVLGLFLTVEQFPSMVTAVVVAVDQAWSWFRWVATGYQWTLVAVGSVFVLETAIERPRRDPSRIFLLVMVAAPLSISIGYEFGLLASTPADPTVFGFVVTGLAGLAAIDRFRLFDVPFARSQIVEHLVTPVLVCGPDDKLYDYNRRAAAALDIDTTALGTDIRAVLSTVEPSLAEADIETLDGRLVALPGVDEERHALLTVAPLNPDSGKELGYTLQFTDVTEQYDQKQELAARNQRLQEFAGHVSHDLRNPLAVASGWVDVVRAEEDNEHLETVAEAHTRMETLITDLLALARSEGGPLTLEPVSLGDVVTTAWRGVDTADATLQVASDRSIMAAANRLQQLFENLLRNAVEHGGESVTVTLGTLPDGFYVEDDGPGIPEAERKTVFESGQTSTDSGTGFGLAIVAGIVQSHGWHVDVTESASGGARFEVTGVEWAPTDS